MQTTMWIAAFVLAGASLFASDALHTLRSRVDAAMASQAAEWTLKASTIRDNELTLTWTHGLEQLRVRCVEYAAVSDATAALDGMAHTLQAGGGDPIADVGDAARIWPHWASDGTTTIFFRRANFMCDTIAPGIPLTKRYSAIVVRQIDGL